MKIKAGAYYRIKENWVGDREICICSKSTGKEVAILLDPIFVGIKRTVRGLYQFTWIQGGLTVYIPLRNAQKIMKQIPRLKAELLYEA